MLRRDSRAAVPVTLYVRTLPGDPEDSLTVQFRALQAYADRGGMYAARVYFDVQGGRGHFEAMMAEATEEDPPFRQILVYDEVRLCPRDAELRTRLERNGVTVLCITSPSE